MNDITNSVTSDNTAMEHAIKITPTEEIILNLQSGLPVEYLTSNEKEILEKEYGKDWMKELGYTK